MTMHRLHSTLHRAGRRAPLLAALANVIAAGTAAAATIGLGRPSSFSATFSTNQAATASGLLLHTKGKPPAAGVTVPPRSVSP